MSAISIGSNANQRERIYHKNKISSSHEDDQHDYHQHSNSDDERNPMPSVLRIKQINH
jgi:hypothetical protein